MRTAWEAADGGREARVAPSEARIIHPPMEIDRPVPIVSPPDIRMGYVMPKRDAQGNLLYGYWVAIPVDDFKWVIPDVGTASMAPESRRAGEGGGRR